MSNSLNLRNNWIIAGLANFFVASVMGLLLRLAHVYEIPGMDFRKMMYAHFHISMLGWLYMIVYAIVWYRFLEKNQKERSIYKWLFWISQFSVLGMMLSFPIQGYGNYSVFFVCLHIITSYLFIAQVWRKLYQPRTPSALLLKTAFIWMLISTAGIWVLAYIVTGGIRNLALYHMSIQFFLHFQFNGWFTFAVLAVFMRELELRNIISDLKPFKLFYWLLVVSCLLTYALSVTWSNPDQLLFFINGSGVVLQLFSLVVFMTILGKILKNFSVTLSPIVKIFYLLALVSFLSKILIQSVVVLPQFAVISYTIRQFVVGFIHLTVLGSVSAFLIGFLIQKELISSQSRLNQWGLLLFLISFILMEVLLFLQGLFLWLNKGFINYYYEAILIISVSLTIGVFMLFLNAAFKKSNKLKDLTF